MNKYKEGDKVYNPLTREKWLVLGTKKVKKIHTFYVYKLAKISKSVYNKDKVRFVGGFTARVDIVDESYEPLKD